MSAFVYLFNFLHSRLPRHVGAPKDSLHHHHQQKPPGNTGSTPLHFAAAGGHLNIIHILLQFGANPNKFDKNGQVPATLALHYGHKDIVHLLVNHTMNTSQTKDEAIDSLEDQIIRNEESKHRRPSLPSIIEQSSSTIKSTLPSTSNLKRNNLSRNRRFSHGESLANVKEAESPPVTPIEESFNLNRATATFSNESVNDFSDNYHQPQQQQHQIPPPPTTLRRLVSKQSLASLFSRSKNDGGTTSSSSRNANDYVSDEDGRPRSYSNASISPNRKSLFDTEYTMSSAPSSPRRISKTIPNLSRKFSNKGLKKEESLNNLINEGEFNQNVELKPPPIKYNNRDRTNTISTISSSNTKSSNNYESCNTSPTNSSTFIFNNPISQSQHAQQAHAERQQKRQQRAQSNQRSLQSLQNQSENSKNVTHQSQENHDNHEINKVEKKEKLSHAQAVELVKEIENDLLMLAESGRAPNTNDKRESGVEQADLVDRLQKYGESLALVRETKKKEEELNNEVKNVYSKRQSSLQHNKLKQSQNLAKRNKYNVNQDAFNDSNMSYVPSPLHLTHTNQHSLTKYSKLFKGIKSKLSN